MFKVRCIECHALFSFGNVKQTREETLLKILGKKDFVEIKNVCFCGSRIKLLLSKTPDGVNVECFGVREVIDEHTEAHA